MTSMKKITLATGACLGLLLLGACSAQDDVQEPELGAPVETREANAPDQVPAFPEQTRAPSMRSNVSFKVEKVAEGLVDLWGMAFLPDGRLLVTERDGRMRIVKDGELSPPVEGVPEITRQEISGLADVVLDPDFAENNRIFWSYIEGRPEGNMLTIARGTLVDGATPKLEDVELIYRQLPSLPSEHGNFGARLLFDNEGYLFATLGDLASNPLRPYIQDPGTGIGKIVRITKDGDPAPNGPFADQEGALPELWALGFRNPIGLTFRPGTDELWGVDIGPAGGDELNLIEPGKNYGWPIVSYGTEYGGAQLGEGTVGEGYEQPVYYWDPVISPSSIAFYTGDMFPAWKGNAFATSLSQQHLVRLVLDGDRVVGEERLLANRETRLRLVKPAADGSIYILTDGPEGEIWRLVAA
jgi:glucose/arabinose dehydrogenase